MVGLLECSEDCTLDSHQVARAVRLFSDARANVADEPLCLPAARASDEETFFVHEESGNGVVQDKGFEQRHVLGKLVAGLRFDSSREGRKSELSQARNCHGKAGSL